MPQITAIEPQKRKKDRFNIYLDGEFAFGLDLQALIQANLKVGQDLTNAQVEKLVLENEVGKILDKVLRFLSFRPRSKKEIADYLKRKETGSKVNELVFKKLEKYGYVDDLEFAKAWIQSRNRLRPRGISLLRAELFQKGIDKEIVDQVLEENKELQFDLAKRAVEKKIKLWKNLEYRQFFQKVSAHLLRRGFSYQIAKNVVDSFRQKG